MTVMLLPANTPQSFYRGAGRIHRFRGDAADPDPYHPEDWVASTTSRSGQHPPDCPCCLTGSCSSM